MTAGQKKAEKQRSGAGEISPRCQHEYDHLRADSFRDEAPGAYKDIRAVMRAQRELVRVERELRPLLTYR